MWYGILADNLILVSIIYVLFLIAQWNCAWSPWVAFSYFCGDLCKNSLTIGLGYFWTRFSQHVFFFMRNDFGWWSWCFFRRMPCSRFTRGIDTAHFPSSIDLHQYLWRSILARLTQLLFQLCSSRCGRRVCWPRYCVPSYGKLGAVYWKSWNKEGPVSSATWLLDYIFGPVAAQPLISI